MKKIGIITIGLAAAALLLGCETTPAAHNNDTPRVSEARKSQLQDSLNRRYENPDAHYELGKIYHQQGQFDRAEFHYNVAIGFDPIHRRAQAAMVKLFYDREDPQRAQIVADTYINQAATSAGALMALGRGFQREQLDDLALRCYKRAQELSPNTASIHKQLGYFYLARGDSVRAETHLRRSFELDHNQPDVAADLGRMGVRVQVPPRKSTGLLGPLRSAEQDETIKD